MSDVKLCALVAGLLVAVICIAWYDLRRFIGDFQYHVGHEFGSALDARASIAERQYRDWKILFLKLLDLCEISAYIAEFQTTVDKARHRRSHVQRSVVRIGTRAATRTGGKRGMAR